MPSGTVTTTVRSDHTQWQCISCWTTNSMTNQTCSNCKKLRFSQAMAVSDDGEILGNNAGLDKNGKEQWYYNVQTNGT
jgi:hypothetical protein